jgi:hypothetical protein
MFRRKAQPMNEQLHNNTDLPAEVQRLQAVVADLTAWVEDVRPWVDTQVGDWRFRVKRSKEAAAIRAARATAMIAEQQESARTENVITMADAIPLDGSMKIKQ